MGSLLVGMALLGVVAPGCGGGDAGPAEVDTSATTTPPDVTFPEPTVPKGAPKPPPEASDALKEIYRQFTLRKPDPQVKGSAKAIAAGRAACAGKTAVQVEEKYFPIAVEMGNLEPESGQAKMIGEIAKYAKNVARDPSSSPASLPPTHTRPPCPNA